MKRILIVSLLLLLCMAVVPALAVPNYAEAFNQTDTVVNTSRISPTGASTGGVETSLWFYAIDKIGEPTRLFWSSGGTAVVTQWLSVWDIPNETHQTPITFWNTANNTQFGSGILHYQVQWKEGTTTAQMLNVWIDGITWDTSLIGSPTGTYVVKLRFDVSAMDGLSLLQNRHATLTGNSLNHNLGWDFWSASESKWAVANIGGAALYDVIQCDQEWNNYLEVTNGIGYQDIELWRNGYISNFKANTSTSIFHNSYSNEDLTGSLAVRVYGSPYTINVTSPFGSQFLRTLYNSAPLNNAYRMTLSTYSPMLNSNLTAYLTYSGTNDPAARIVYSAGEGWGQFGQDIYIKVGSQWKKAIGSSYLDVSAAQAYNGIIQFDSYWHDAGPDIVYCTVFDAAGNQLARLSEPVTLTDAGQTSALSINVRDISTGGYIPNAQINLTNMAEGSTSIQNTGSGTRKTVMVDRYTLYRINATASGYLKSDDLTVQTNDITTEVNIWMNRIGTSLVNMSTLNFGVYDNATGRPITAALVQVSNQSPKYTTTYGAASFVVPMNQTLTWNVIASNYAPVSGSFIPTLTQYNIRVDMGSEQAIPTTLPGTPDIYPSINIDWQHDAAAREKRTWDIWGIFYNGGYLIGMLAFLAIVTGLVRKI